MKKRLKTLFYGMSHEHAPGKIATLRKLADDFEVVAIADDTARHSPSFHNMQFDASGYRIVSESEALKISDIDVVFVETANRDLMEIAGVYAERGIAMHCDKPGGVLCRRLRVDGTKGTIDLCPIERFDGRRLTLKLSAGETVKEMDFGVQTDRYADQLLELAAIVRGVKPNDQDYDRDLKTHEITLRACGL